MAQGSNAVREPSMDELLASIREIIEENAGASASGGVGTSPADGGGHDMLVSDYVEKTDEPILKNIELPSDGEQEVASALQVSKPQNMPVQDAMNALAERIGLRRQAEEPTKSGESTQMVAGSALSPAFPYVSDVTANVSPFPVEKVASPSVPAKPLEKSNNEPVGKEKKMPVPSGSLPSQQPVAAQPLPPQTADKILQQSPFQMQLQPSYPPNSAMKPQQQRKGGIQSSPLPSSPSVPQPPSIPPAIRVQPETIPVGRQPMPPSFQAQPFPFQIPQQSPAAKPRTEASHAGDVKGKWEELEKDFRAEFEKSAELLLRPYIAQWLDKHFHHLFEKILREEIQRLVQNLHR